MKLLITGGAGFIGGNFIHYWLKEHPEDHIINLDALTYAGNLKTLSLVADNPNYQFIQGNITDAPLVNKLVADVDTVVHFAAETHVDRSITGPDVFVMTNVVGTQVLLDAAVEHKLKRFHHISTDEVYGSLPLDTPDQFSETTPYNPHSPYSASKAGSDHLVRAYRTTYELPVTITNCSNNYGSYQFPEKLIPLTITNSIQGKKVPQYGDGLYVRDWLHVEDHCRAIDRVLTDGKIGETYCVGGLTEDINNKAVLEMIVDHMGADRSVIEIVTDRPGHDRRYSVNWSKIKDELGWRPEYDFETGLQQTIDWYKTNEEWWRPLLSNK